MVKSLNALLLHIHVYGQHVRFCLVEQSSKRLLLASTRAINRCSGDARILVRES